MSEIERIQALEVTGKVFVTRRTELHLALTHPVTGRSVVFYPSSGTIVRNNVRQVGSGLDAALKHIGVRE